jgi:hypothetical protein
VRPVAFVFRSALRIRDGREKPIDILAKNILLLQAQENDGSLRSVISGDNVVDHAIMQCVSHCHDLCAGKVLHPLCTLRHSAYVVRLLCSGSSCPSRTRYWRACPHQS